MILTSLLIALAHVTVGIIIATLYAIASYNRRQPISRERFWTIAFFTYPLIALHVLFIEFPQLFGWIK